jgi:VanZ family protein
MRTRWLPPIVWAAVVLTATSLPNLSIPGPAGSDKVGHFFMYCMLGFLLQRAAAPVRSARRLAFVAMGVAVFAALDEWHQGFIPGRAADVADFVADVAGAATGCLLAHAAAPRRPEVA